MLALEPVRDHPVRRPVLGLRPRRPAGPGRPARRPGVPVLGICYGFQLMVRDLGGRGPAYRNGGVRGHRPAARPMPPACCSTACPAQQRVWMSHGDTCAAPPPGFAVTATTAGHARWPPPRHLTGSCTACSSIPEVLHTEHGMAMLRSFLAAAGCKPTWTMRGVIEEQTERIAAQVGSGRAICGLSGGVDSAVAAALVQRAIGDRLTCVFVDHGLLRDRRGRAGREGLRRRYRRRAQGRRRRRRSSSARWPASATRSRSARSSGGSSSGRSSRPRARYRRCGQTRPRSWSRARCTPTWWSRAAAPARPTSSRTTTSADCPDDLKFELVEPLRDLFKDEVRQVGTRARAAGRDRLAAAVPRPRPGDQDRRRGHRRAAAHRRRAADAIARAELSAAGPGPADLAVPGRAAGRRALRRRPG